jgi:hypothetical protein
MMEFYQIEPSYLTSFVNRLKSLYNQPGNPKHVIVIAHLTEYEGTPDFQGRGSTKFRNILSQGKKGGELLPMKFDDVYSFGIQQPANVFDPESKIKRLCYTQAFGEDMAKCSWPFPKIIDCTDVRLYDHLSPLMKIERTLVTSNE